MSAETRKLMETVLASEANKDEMSARVAALLAGTSLTTTRGAAKGEGRQVDSVEYNGGKRCAFCLLIVAFTLEYHSIQ